MSVAYEIQKAIVTRLKAHGPLTALIAGRVYDRVPPSATLPYVNIRNIQVVEDSADCVDGAEVFIDLDAWSNAVGKPEVSRISSAVRAALNQVELTLTDPFVLLDIEHQDTNIGEDEGDPLLNRARMTFRALAEGI